MSADIRSSADPKTAGLQRAKPCQTTRAANTDSDTAGPRRASPAKGRQLSSKAGLGRAASKGRQHSWHCWPQDMHGTAVHYTTAPPDQDEGTHTVQLPSGLADTVSLANQAGGLLHITALGQGMAACCKLPFNLPAHGFVLLRVLSSGSGAGLPASRRETAASRVRCDPPAEWQGRRAARAGIASLQGSKQHRS